VLAGGQGFHPDQAALVLDFICVKKWMNDLDDAGFARLNTLVLRRWIQTRALDAIRDHLGKAGVLETAGYSAGHFGTGYQIIPFYDGPPSRRVVEYPPLVEKLTTWRAAYKTAGDDPQLAEIRERRRPLLDHQRDSLAALSLPGSLEELIAAMPAPKARRRRNRKQGQQVPESASAALTRMAGHVEYIRQCLEHGDHDGLSIDGFGYRVHSLITRTSSRLRPRLLLDGRAVAEVDIGNSQPMLLAILANLHHAQHIDSMRNIMEGAGAGAGSLLFLPAVSPAEAVSFLRCCETGELYTVLAEEAEGEGRKIAARAQHIKLNRERAKVALFRDVLFGKPFVDGPVTRAFGRRWPSLLEAIRKLKREHGYKALAQALQRLESYIMLDCICPRLMRDLPGVRFLTIHDSALLVADAAKAVKAIMLDEFSKWGATPTIRIKPAATAGERSK
jgi:hypothetical protein